MGTDIPDGCSGRLRLNGQPSPCFLATLPSVSLCRAVVDTGGSASGPMGHRPDDEDHGLKSLVVFDFETPGEESGASGFLGPMPSVLIGCSNIEHASYRVLGDRCGYWLDANGMCFENGSAFRRWMLLEKNPPTRLPALRPIAPIWVGGSHTYAKLAGLPE